MSFLAKMKSGSHALNHRHGFGSYAVDKIERLGGAYALGFAKGYYREKMLIGGEVPADALGGFILTVGGGLLTMMTNGRSSLAPHADALGTTGLQSWLGSLGASAGAKKSGRTVYVLDAGARPPAALPGLTAVGEIPAAVGGAWLTPQEIAAFNAART